MSFLLACPTCGARDVNEFVYAGEVTERPRATPTQRELGRYVYFRRNVAGAQREGGSTASVVSSGSSPSGRSTDVLTTERALPRSPGEAPAPAIPPVPDSPAV